MILGKSVNVEKNIVLGRIVDFVYDPTINKKLLSDAGLASAFKDKFENRLMFTITDVTGRVIGFGGRTLDGSGAKYINSPATALFDKSNCIFGLEQSQPRSVSNLISQTLLLNSNTAFG